MRGLPHGDFALTISIDSVEYSPMRQNIHRVNEKRINHKDVASLVEGADDSPDESVREIHCAEVICP